MRILKSGLLLILIFALLAGCSNSGSSSSGSTDKSGKVTLVYWHTFSDEEEKVFKDKVIPMFEKENPEIHIKATRMPTENLEQQVISSAASSAGPDVMRMDLTWVAEFAKLGALKQLDDMEGFDEVKASQLEGNMQTNLYNKKYYGVPDDTNTKVAIYDNKSLKDAGLSEPPKTYDELMQAVKSVKDKNHLGVVIGGTGPWNILPYLWSLGGKVTNDDYTKASGYLNSDASVKATQQLVDWYKDGLIAKTVIGGQPGAWDGLKAHKYFMVDDGPWFYSLQGKEGKKNTTPALMPEGSAGSFSVVGGEDNVIFNGSKHPDAAWKFVKFLASEEPQKIMAEEVGLLPTNKKAMEDPELVKNPITKVYLEQLKTAKPRTPSGEFGKIKEVFSKTFEAIFRGKVSVKDGLDQAAKQIDTLLQSK